MFVGASYRWKARNKRLCIQRKPASEWREVFPSNLTCGASIFLRAFLQEIVSSCGVNPFHGSKTPDMRQLTSLV